MDIHSSAMITASFITVFITFILNKYLYNRSRLVTYLSHASAHKIKDPQGIINTHAKVIRNAGRIAAKNVRVGHNKFTELISCTVYPPIEYETKEIEGGIELFFPILIPGEQITISYLYFPPVTIGNFNTYIKSDEGFAKILNIIPSPKLPSWLEKILYILLFIGSLVVTYLLVRLLIFCFSNVPQALY